MENLIFLARISYQFQWNREHWQYSRGKWSEAHMQWQKREIRFNSLEWPTYSITVAYVSSEHSRMWTPIRAYSPMYFPSSCFPFSNMLNVHSNALNTQTPMHIDIFVSANVRVRWLPSHFYLLSKFVYVSFIEHARFWALPETKSTKIDLLHETAAAVFMRCFSGYSFELCWNEFLAFYWHFGKEHEHCVRESINVDVWNICVTLVFCTFTPS